MDALYGRALVQWPLGLAAVTIFGTAVFAVAAGSLGEREADSIVSALVPLWRVMSVILLLTGTAMILLLTTEMAGVPWREAIPLIPEVLKETHAGEVWRWAIPTVIALAAVSFARLGTAAAFVLAVLSAVLMLMEALVSHAIDRGAIAVAFYWVHEAASGTWIGALLGLWLVARRAHPSRDWIARATRMVSSTAAWSVAAIVVSGSYTAYGGIGFSVDRLVFSSYGRTLLVKVIAFCAVLSIGAYNRERLLPEITGVSSQKVLLRNAGIESLLLGTVVFSLAALLANTPPAAGHMMDHSGMPMSTLDRQKPVSGTAGVVSLR